LTQSLSAPERTEFEAVIAQAASTGAQAVRYYSEAGGVIVIGLMTDGRLETWFASPARNNVEAIAAQAIVMHGLAQASHALATLLDRRRCHRQRRHPQGRPLTACNR
jgi:hypothetical protein